MRSNELKKKKDAQTVKEMGEFLFERTELLERTHLTYRNTGISLTLAPSLRWGLLARMALNS